VVGYFGFFKNINEELGAGLAPKLNGTVFRAVQNAYFQVFWGYLGLDLL
jgi:hypothetical protein